MSSAATPARRCSGRTPRVLKSTASVFVAVPEEAELREEAPAPAHGRHGPEAVRIGEEEADVLPLRRAGEEDQVRIEQRPGAGVEGEELLLRDLRVEEVAREDGPREPVEQAQLLRETAQVERAQPVAGGERRLGPAARRWATTAAGSTCFEK